MTLQAQEEEARGVSPRCSRPDREQEGLLVAVSVTSKSQGHKAREETEE